MLSLRKLLFVSAIKQIAAQWFQLTSKSSSQAVIVISKPEIYYLGYVLESSKRFCPRSEEGFLFLLTFSIPYTPPPLPRFSEAPPHHPCTVSL